MDDRDALGFLPPQVGTVFRKEARYLKRNSFLFFALVAAHHIKLRSRNDSSHESDASIDEAHSAEDTRVHA